LCVEKAGRFCRRAIQAKEQKDISGLNPSAAGRCVQLHKVRKPMPDRNLPSALLDLTDELFVVSTLLEMLQNGAAFGTAPLTLETCAAAASKCQELVARVAARC
jgi:hypothetical protein